jgi:tetratricopeptide (TPR) repeat protein
MTPYRSPFSEAFQKTVFSWIVLTALAVVPARASSGADKQDFDALTKSGFSHYYNLEYDQAIRDFQRAWEERPDEPNAINHLLEASLFQELYKHNALDTRLYTKERFLSSKHVPVDPAMKKRFTELFQQAMAASDKRLRSNPKDVQALYSRGVTQGLESTYLAVAEHSFWSALRHALAARNDHEEVLKLQPGFTDAKTVVGAHEYVVGSLSMPAKIMAGIVGIHGDKNKGLRMLAEAGQAGGDSSTDANVTLALFLRREQRYPEAIEVVRGLTRDHPTISCLPWKRVTCCAMPAVVRSRLRPTRLCSMPAKTADTPGRIWKWRSLPWVKLCAASGNSRKRWQPIRRPSAAAATILISTSAHSSAPAKWPTSWRSVMTP